MTDLGAVSVPCLLVPLKTMVVTVIKIMNGSKYVLWNMDAIIKRPANIKRVEEQIRHLYGIVPLFILPRSPVMPLKLIVGPVTRPIMAAIRLVSSTGPVLLTEQYLMHGSSLYCKARHILFLQNK